MGEPGAMHGHDRAGCAPDRRHHRRQVPAGFAIEEGGRVAQRAGIASQLLEHDPPGAQVVQNGRFEERRLGIEKNALRPFCGVAAVARLARR